MPSVFTVAKGNKKYIRMAIALARSFALHNDVDAISFYLFSDQIVSLPPDLDFVHVRLLPEVARTAPGLEFKLYFDQIAPDGGAIFIDADCLVFRDLAPLFLQFAETPVSVIGFNITQGDWCGSDTESVLRKTGLPYLIRFNGGLYYINRGNEADAVYNTARALRDVYDGLGFSRIGANFINDEPLLSMALVTHRLKSIFDDSSVLADLSCDRRKSTLDVVKGTIQLVNCQEGDPARRWWHNIEQFSPAILHYGSGGYRGYLFARESAKLMLASRFGAPSIAIIGADTACRMLYRLRSGPNGSKL